MGLIGCVSVSKLTARSGACARPRPPARNTPRDSRVDPRGMAIAEGVASRDVMERVFLQMETHALLRACQVCAQWKAWIRWSAFCQQALRRWPHAAAHHQFMSDGPTPWKAFISFAKFAYGSAERAARPSPPREIYGRDKRLDAEWERLCASNNQVQCRCTNCRRQIPEHDPRYRMLGMLGGGKPLYPVLANFWQELLDRYGGCAAAEFSKYVCVGPSHGAAGAAPGEAKWDGLLLGPPNTPYFGGLFRFEITYPSQFPFQPPRIAFTTDIRHPCVSMAMRLVSTRSTYILGHDWQPTIFQDELLVILVELLKGNFCHTNANDAPRRWFNCWEIEAAPYLVRALPTSTAAAAFKAEARRKTAQCAVDTSPV